MSPESSLQLEPLVDSPLRQPALYNPHLLSREELSTLFVARQPLLRGLLEDLEPEEKRASLQHHLIVGQRGMGKTMLLRRLQIAIEERQRLARRWIPITFPEEQYNVRELSDFWLNCLDALGDLLDRRGERDRAQAVDREQAALESLKGPARSERTLAFLSSFCRGAGRKLVLLVDNIDMVLDRIRSEQWAFREVLSANENLLIIGASSRAVESTYRGDAAFYDFFRIHELGGLDFEATQALLLNYSDRLGTPQVRSIVESDPGRIRSLHTLTGGNPRTLVLLYRILMQGIDGDVRTDLEQLLDQCTPLYKARLEELSTQAQHLIHGLALHWDPISAGELAEELRLNVNIVSSQLNRLVRQGVVQKVPYDPPSKTGFQISERFFNIWYLMRSSRRVRQKLIWLVQFLRLFYGAADLRSKALLHLRKESGAADNAETLRKVELGFALAGALDDEPLASALETQALEVMVSAEEIRRKLDELLDLNGRDARLRPKAEHLETLREAKETLRKYATTDPEWSFDRFWKKLARSPWEDAERKLVVAKEILASGDEAWRREEARLDDEHRTIVGHIGCSPVSDALSQAIAQGCLRNGLDVEHAEEAAVRFDCPSLVPVVQAIRMFNWSRPVTRSQLDALESSLSASASALPFIIWLSRSRELDTKADLDSVLRALLDLVGSSPEAMDKSFCQLFGWSRLADLPREFLRASPGPSRKKVPWWAVLVEYYLREGRPLDAVSSAYQAVRLSPVTSAFWADLLRAMEAAERDSVEGSGLPSFSTDDARRTLQLSREALGSGKLQDFTALGAAVQDLLPDDPYVASYFTQVFALSGDWSRSAAALLAAFHHGDENLLFEDQDRILDACLRFVRGGQAALLREVVAESPIGDRWRPLKEALDALNREGHTHLRRLAPEIRRPTEVLLRYLSDSGDTAPPLALETLGSQA